MVKGSCLCGNVNYNLDIDPDAENPVCRIPVLRTSLCSRRTQTSVCHCRPCRKITGSTTSLNLTVPSTAFALSSGTLKTIKMKHIDEGFEASILFCGDCGTPIYAVPHWEPQPDIKVIQVGTLDDVAFLEKTPTIELNITHRLKWALPITGAEQRKKYT